jgi:hypothetical protein
MYKENNKFVSLEEIEQALLKKGWVINDIKEWKKRNGSMIEFGIKDLANQLYNLNNAILNDRSVFAICTKEPRNLDSGKHYYQVFYNNEKGITSIFWFPPIMGKTEKSGRRWSFTSGAIGMSRVFDATDVIFNLLKFAGGCYVQIETLA